MRRTTSYLLEVRVPEGDPNPVADELIASYTGDVEASGVGRNRAFIRLRAKNDGEALLAIRDLPLRERWTLSRGYGIHHEVVAIGGDE